MLVEPRSLVALAAQLACSVLALLLVPPARGSRPRLLAAATLAVAALAAPFASADADTFFRCGQSLLAGACVARVADFARDPRPWPAWMRVASQGVLFDLRRTGRYPDRSSSGLLSGALLVIVAAAVGIWLVAEAEKHAGAVRWALRWSGGVLIVYGVLDTYAKLGMAVFRLAGVTAAPIHRDPVLSRTLAEFWGERWNLVVHGWIVRHVVRPLARRGRAAALAGAFLSSALLHAYIVLASTERIVDALMMSLYFVLQGIGWALETRWFRSRGALARAWTIAWVLLPSPLFIEPLLRALVPGWTGP